MWSTVSESSLPANGDEMKTSIDLQLPHLCHLPASLPTGAANNTEPGGHSVTLRTTF